MESGDQPALYSDAVFAVFPDRVTVAATDSDLRFSVWLNVLLSTLFDPQHATSQNSPIRMSNGFYKLRPAFSAAVERTGSDTGVVMASIAYTVVGLLCIVVGLLLAQVLLVFGILIAMWGLFRIIRELRVHRYNLLIKEESIPTAIYSSADYPYLIAVAETINQAVALLRKADLKRVAAK